MKKWILYNKVKWKRSWVKQNKPPRTTSKAGRHPKTVLLCIWSDWEGVLYYELLLKSQMINSKKYHYQVDQMKAAINEKHLGLVNRKCITFHQDNTRQHVPLMTRQKLLETVWEVLTHPSYSPDIAPLNFHLFWSLQNSLSGNNSTSWKTMKSTWNSSLLEKIKRFGTMKPWCCLENGRR